MDTYIAPTPTDTYSIKTSQRHHLGNSTDPSSSRPDHSRARPLHSRTPHRREKPGDSTRRGRSITRSPGPLERSEASDEPTSHRRMPEKPYVAPRKVRRRSRSPSRSAAPEAENIEVRTRRSGGAGEDRRPIVTTEWGWEMDRSRSRSRQRQRYRRRSDYAHETEQRKGTQVTRQSLLGQGKTEEDALDETDGSGEEADGLD